MNATELILILVFLGASKIVESIIDNSHINPIIDQLSISYLMSFIALESFFTSCALLVFNRLLARNISFESLEGSILSMLLLISSIGSAVFAIIMAWSLVRGWRCLIEEAVEWKKNLQHRYDEPNCMATTSIMVTTSLSVAVTAFSSWVGFEALLSKTL